MTCSESTALSFFVILLVALIVLGPDGLRMVLQGIRSTVEWLKGLSGRLRESSPELRGLHKPDEEILLDLNQYNPAEIIRQAVREESAAWVRQLEGKDRTP